ncbi:MAG: electron transport complex subunit RsxA [Christensenellales bacterium]|jgi:electron transport complex protein RnfA
MSIASANGIVKIILILLNAILCNNVLLVQFQGICPFLGVSRKVETATGMGLAVTFVMALAALVTWLVQKFVLETLGLEYLQTLTFILVIAALVQFVEMFLQKSSPTLYQSLGVYLPLITTNCAVLGVTIININSGYGLGTAMVNAVGTALGFTLAIVLLAGIRERLELGNTPKSLRGFSISLITAGLMAIAFLGFTGLITR